MNLLTLLAMYVLIVAEAWEPAIRMEPYLQVLREHGQTPAQFVVERLKTFDLLIFDDALHTAVEPFEFYQQLIKEPSIQKLAPAIFLEAIPSNKQRHLDEYLAAATDDPRLLYPAFQDDANGMGFPYQTYFDLLQTIRAVNRTLPEAGRFKIYGVGSPTFWKEIDTPRDLEFVAKLFSASPTPEKHEVPHG